MAHGLGLHTRELDTGQAAQDALVARAQGSLVPNQTRPAATTPVGAGQQAGQPATARPTRGFGSPGIPSLEDDPLGAISFALREVGAALQGKKLPSETAREGANDREELGIRQQGLRLKGIGLGMKALKSGLEILDTIPNDQADAAIEQLTKSVQIPGFDMGAILKAHKEGVIEGFKARLDQIRNDPTSAAFLASIPDIETSSPKALNSAMGRVLKLRDDLIGEVAKQGALAPGKRGAAEEKAALEVKTAGQKTLVTERAKQKVRGEGPRELEGARTVNTNEDIPLPGGGAIPKGTAITVRPVKNKPFSVTSVFSDGKTVEVEIPDAVIPGLTRERKLEAPTATQRGQIELRIRFLDDALSQLQKLKRVVEDTPTGAAGEIVKALQGTYDQALTLAETVPGVDALVNIAESGIAFIDSSLFEAKTAEEQDELANIRRSFLNTDLPAIPIIQEGIAIALAAASFPTTQRIPVEAIKEARKNVDLTGLFGPGRGTALAKLNTIIARIESNKTFLGQRKTAIEQPTIKGKPVSREERKRKLLEKFGIKPR